MINPASPSKRGQIFLSYGRKDDEAWVKRLRDYLRAKQIPVWWDEDSMESRGRTFLQEIRDAIHDSERVLFVIGPGALKSDYVRTEWEHALLYSRAILPLLREGEFADIPAAYGLYQGIDCREAREEDLVFREIFARLETPIPPLGELRGMPPLPPSYVPRKDLFQAITASVTADLETVTTIDPKRQLTFLRGMPGTGKSVLAVAFARARATRAAFASGVVFIRVGKASTVETILRNTLAALGVAAQPADDEASLTTLLQQQLEHDRVLLILDDVWRMDRIEPFRRALGLRTRILVTTRDSSLASGLQATEIEIDVLDSAQALELLALVSGVPESKLPPEAVEIVSESGRLPLSLAIIGALLRQFPDRWVSYRDRLRRGRIDAIKATLPEYLDANLARVIAISLEDLPSETQRRFLDLGILRDPPRIPRAVLEAWWTSEGLDPIDAEDALDVLSGRSLLRREAGGMVSLHDLCIDYARHFHPALEEAHVRLVAFYERASPAGFAAHPDDGYLFENLGHHLEAAGRVDALLHLVLNSPDWLTAKSPAVRPQSDGLDDIDRLLGSNPPLEAQAALHMAAHVWRMGAALWAPADLETLVHLGREDEALQAAALRSQDPFAGYLRLATVFAGRDKEAAKQLLESAERAARLDPAAWSRAKALTEVSRVWRSIDDVERADTALAEAMQLALAPMEAEEDKASWWFLKPLIDELIQAGRDADARAIAEAQPDEFGTSWSALAAALARREEVALVDQIVAERLATQPIAIRAAHAGQLADAAPKGEARQRWLAEGLALWRQLNDIANQSQSPDDFAARFQAAQLLLPPAYAENHPAVEELREVLRTYPVSGGSFLELSSGLSAVQGLSLFGDLEGAKELTKQLRTNRGEAQFWIVHALLQAGEIDQAITAAQEVGTIQDRAAAYSMTALDLARRGDRRAAAMLDNASALYLEDRARTHLFNAALLCAQALLPTNRETGRRLLQWIATRIEHLSPDFDFSSSLADFSRTCFAEGLALEGDAAQAKITNEVLSQELIEQVALDQARAGNLERATALVELLDTGWQKEAIAAEVLILGQRWDDASAAVNAITRDYNRIVERAHLAAGIRPTDSARSDALFSEAEQEATVLQDEWSPDQLREAALAEIVTARLACGQTGPAWEIITRMAPSLDKAQTALRYVEAIWEQQRDEAIPILQGLLEVAPTNDQAKAIVADLTRTLIHCELGGDAVDCIEKLSAIDRSVEHRTGISRLYAAMGDFEEASRQILTESVDLYAGAVASWAPHYEEIEPGLSHRVLSEITRVAGWSREDWRQVHEIVRPGP